MKKSNLCELYYEKLQLNRYFDKDIKPFLKLYEFKKDDFICQYGDHLNTFYFHAEGRMQVYRLSQNGKAVVLTILEPGTIIGDVEFISKEIATSYVQAISDCKLIGIDFNVLRDEFYDDTKFLHLIIDSLALKLVTESRNYVDNQTSTLEQRLASFMLEVEEEHGEIIIFKMTSLAEWFGVSYRHLSRTLKSFEENQYIVRDKKKVKIINHSALEEIIKQ